MEKVGNSTTPTINNQQPTNNEPTTTLRYRHATINSYHNQQRKPEKQWQTTEQLKK
jgi:hypothetical protein